MKIKTGTREIIEYIAVLMIILSSGSAYFGIVRCAPTLCVLLLVAILSVITCGISRKTVVNNFVVAAVIIVVVVFNLLMNSEYARWDNDMLILCIRIVSLVLIQSSIDLCSFIKKYVYIFSVFSVISIICYAYTMLVGINLPGLEVGNNMMCTFYHTVGTSYVYSRNAGIFWEAPAYSIFLNIALSFVILRRDCFRWKKIIRLIVLFAITIATTLSVIAFLCLGINILLLFFSSNSGNTLLNEMNNKRKIRRFIYIGTLTLILLLVYMEFKYGLIQYKLFNKAGSYGTRYGDTYYTIYMASKRIFTGYGIFNNVTSGLLQALNVVNNSNGLAILLMNGGIFVFSIAVLWYIKALKKIFNVKRIMLIMVVALFFIYNMSEHLWTFTLFISFMFTWKDKKS